MVPCEFRQKVNNNDKVIHSLNKIL